MKDHRYSKETGSAETPRRYDRRAFPRTPIRFQVRYGKGQALMEAPGMEIGTGGMSFAAETLFPMAEEISVEYKLSDDAPWVKLRGVVKHSEGKKQGVEFLNLRMRDRLKIVDFLSQNR